jgi:hypothetical protein
MSPPAGNFGNLIGVARSNRLATFVNDCQHGAL